MKLSQESYSESVESPCLIPYNIATLPVTLLYFVNAGIWLYYGIRLRKEYETSNFTNTVCTVALWVAAGMFYPFFYQNATPQVEFLQIIASIVIVGITPLLLFLILYYQKRVVARKPVLKEARTIDNFLKKYGLRRATFGKKEGTGTEPTKEDYTLKVDLKRKLLHFVPAIAIVGMWVFATKIWAAVWGQDVAWQISGEDFGYFLILTVGYAGVFIFAVLEYVRFSYLFPKRNMFHLLPTNVLHLLCGAMKPREFTEFIKPVPLILAFVPGFFLPFGIFASIALGATLGDGAASVIGKRFGKKHWPKNSPKTVAGFIAGFATTFLIGWVCLVLFGSYSIPEIFLLAVVNAGIFLAIDLWNPPIDDNILNPLLCGAGLTLVLFLL